MSSTTLKDDLLGEFREERIMIREQIELLDPLATSLRKPAAQRLLSSGTLIITEVTCYIISLGGIAFMALLHKIYPFVLLGDIFYDIEYRTRLGSENVMMLILGIYGLVLIGITLIFILGRMAREMRLKNDILNQAGKDIKTIVGQHLERKAALDTIEQRHMLGLSGVSHQPAKVNTPETTTAAAFRMSGRGEINDIPNPGFQ